MTVAQEKFPFENFERVVRSHLHDDTAFALAIGRSRDVVRRWRRDGIRFYEADRLSISLGFHPSYFWPDEYWQLPETQEHDMVSTTNTEEQ